MKISPEVLAVLSRSTTDGQILFLPEQMERPMYVAVNKVIVAMGGKWDRRAAGHFFPIDGLDAYDRLERVILTGEVTVAKDEFAFFETQGPALDRVMDAADIQPGESVLEPNAGTGRIAMRAFMAGASHVTMVEIDPQRFDGLRDIAARFFENGQGSTLIGFDFLEAPIKELFDRVVMNPPFAVPRNRREDIAHVRHAWEFVKPGGRLVAVMASGISFREDAQSRSFRGWVDGFEGSFEPMPADSFKASGTSVNTVLLTMDKPK